jgi:hypothetical protein
MKIVTFEICPVCNWENDDVQFNNPDFEGGVNIESLNKARESFKKIGASYPRFVKRVRKPLPEEMQGKT